MGKLPFCITSIMRNERDLLPRYFDSIENNLGKVGVDIEVIIVDTNSTDDSVAYARERGAVVHEEGDRFSVYYKRHDVRKVLPELEDKDVIKVGDRVFKFDEARNCANDHATTDWCMSLDICDIVVHCDITKLTNFIELIAKVNTEGIKALEAIGGPDSSEAHTLINKISWGVTYTLHYGGIENPVPLVQSASKLYYRHVPNGKWRCHCHEVFSGFGSSRRVPPSSLKPENDCLVVRHAQRANVNHNYLPSLAYSYLVQPPDSEKDKARLLYYFARELCYRKQYGNVTGTTGAKKYLAKVCASKLNWIKERSSSACFLATCYSIKEPEYMEKKRRAYILATQLYPGWREPYLKLSECAYEQSDWAGLIAYAEIALTIPRPTDVVFSERSVNYTTEPYRLSMLGYARLAKCAHDAGVDSRDMIQKALDLEALSGCSDNVHYTNWQIAYVVWQRHDLAKARSYFDRCYATDPEKCKHDRKFFY